MNPEKFNVVIKFLEQLVEDEDFQCKYCFENFNTTAELKAHSITKHMEKRHVCDFCLAEYKTSMGMLSHLKTQHMYIPDIISNTKSQKKIKIWKEDDDNYNPETDVESESDDSVYDEYNDEGKKNKVPDREYPRKCDHCDYEVPRKGVHYHHYIFMHRDILDQYPWSRNKIPCSICGVLKPAGRLKMHEAKHSGVKVKCPTCGKEYISHVHMKTHQARVHTKKRLICDFCAKEFKTRIDITRHLRIHTGERPYKCHICGAGYAHSGNILIHIRSAHQNVKNLPKKVKNNKTKTEKKTRGRGRPRIKKVKTKCSDSESDDEALSVIQKKKHNGEQSGRKGKKHK